jgi:Cd2+/Zn2+-exporting ATPase
VVEVVVNDGFSEDMVITLAAIAEKYSEHPLAKSVMALATKRSIVVPDPDEFKAEVGFGVTASYEGNSIVVGKEEFFRERGITLSEHLISQVSTQTEHGRTAVLVACGGDAVGLIAVADEVRAETAGAVAAFKTLGIRHITMLTGDNSRVAQAVAEQIGVDDFHAGLLPEDKQQVVKDLQAQGRTVAMVGDGINDAPALALADIGIVMGAAGTDAAIEAADVTLMNDDLVRVVEFVQMSRLVLRRIRLNIFFSIIYNAIGLTMATLGMMTPIIAVVFQEAGCFSVVLSSTLLLWARPSHKRKYGARW